LQDYLNDHEEVFTRAVMEALPPRYRELAATIGWVSPFARDNYMEYRDGDFLRAVGLGEFTGELASFWPSGGPSWDALGIISDPSQKMRPNIVLVEAKSHLTEIYGSGCQAGLHSRELIEKSLVEAKDWCSASKDADWTGALYQSANRLAHLYFIRERLGRLAWLVNLCFIGDPIGPADQGAWEAELKKVNVSLGINSEVPFVIDVFLPALDFIENYEPIEIEDASAQADPGSGTSEGGADEAHEPVVDVQSARMAVPHGERAHGDTSHD
jgi:hypothetical protein